ncbi:unnamed protein product [Urochloa humidicola]
MRTAPPPTEAPNAFFADSDEYLNIDLDFARSMDGINAIGVPVPPPELDIAAVGFFYPDHSMSHSVSSSEVAVVPDALAAGGAAAPAQRRQLRDVQVKEKEIEGVFCKIQT